MTLLIRPAEPTDAAAFSAVYNHYIRETVITFEEEPVSGGDMAARMAEVSGASLPWLVAEVKGEVAGYAYGSKWKGRCAYRFTVEGGVYLAPAHTGHGIGTRLYRELLAQLRALGTHTVIGGISLPNKASVALHERLGFTKVAQFREVGFKFGKWVDVGYWQLVLQPPGDVAARAAARAVEDHFGE